MQKILGLSSDEAKQRQIQYGKNEIAAKKQEGFFKKALFIMLEPMFLLLIIAAIIYLMFGELVDGLVMLVFVVAIIFIEIIQEWRTDKTLNALKKLSAPKTKVIRDGKEQLILSEDIVLNDIMIIYEGVKIPADGVIIECNDLCVNESSLTGEAECVWKSTEKEIDNNDYWRKDYCYAGTLVTLGSALVRVEKIGLETEYGKIGKAVLDIKKSRSPLQKQISSLIKVCGLLALMFFILVAVVTFFNLSGFLIWDRITESMLAGIALAMSLIPEEFPVIFTIFLAMGAWRLAKKNSLVRNTSAVETLGAISVLCVDKTGTVTKNQMTVEKTWRSFKDEDLNLVMGLACETNTYDPMEKAMLKYCEEQGMNKDVLFSGELIFEYSFTSELKMMGHVWQINNEIILAAKGSAERILPLCNLTQQEYEEAETQIKEMSSEGLRVIAVAHNNLTDENQMPKSLTDCTLRFCGLVGLSDPPRESIKEDIETCTKAGIRVVMITGDNGNTAVSIAKKIGMQNCENVITGTMLDEMTDDELLKAIKATNIFSRVMPEHKLRIVKAFKNSGEVVAMTGDGVNDVPALKSADIGIAMGQRGSEVSRDAADIILMDDNFSTIVDTIKDGRRIYDNIRKAVGYVLAVHIPIALIALITPLLNITPDFLMLLPLHIALFELIIDPTCSIVLEQQPAEVNIMNRKPRKLNERLLNKKTLIKNIFLGLTIFTSSFGVYYFMLETTADAMLARTMGFAIIIITNSLLVLINSSDTDSIFLAIKKLFKNKIMWIINIIVLILLLVIIYTPINSFLKLKALSFIQLVIVIAFALISVLWFEVVKWARKCKRKN